MSERKQKSQAEIEAELAEAIEKGTAVVTAMFDSRTGILTRAPGMSAEETRLRERAAYFDAESIRRAGELHVEIGEWTKAEADAHFAGQEAKYRAALQEVRKLDDERRRNGLPASLTPKELAARSGDGSTSRAS